MKLDKRRLVIEIEKRTVDKRTGNISFQFRIGPFKKTMATTIGSALRRTLLSMTKTLAITSVCGNFREGNSIREDLFELSLNLQRVHIKSSFFPYIGIGRIRKNGPAIITAKDLNLEEGLNVVNPYQYICTVNEGYKLNLAVMINSPGTNQGTDYIDPLTPINFERKNSIKNRELELESFHLNTKKDFPEENEFTHFPLSNNFIKLKNFTTQSSFTKQTKQSKSDNSTNNTKDSKIKVGAPHKLPIDIVVVDPIYSALQSCGFEIIQTTTSSVGEYEELIKRGVSETEEFLRFVVVSRGAIEPAVAIEAAVQELTETLSILEPVSHIFATEKNLLLLLESINTSGKKQERDKLVSSYTLSVLKKLDIKHLNLPEHLELFLRREGFVTLNNLVSVPLEFLKRVGLRENDVNLIENSLKLFGLSLRLNKNVMWEIFPNTLPF